MIKGLKKNTVPGVGTYELRKDEDVEVPCVKFDKEPRKDISLNQTALGYPGPNKYIKIEGKPSLSPKWSFSKSERFPRVNPRNKNIFRLNVPGPGTYKTIEYTGNEGPLFSFNKDKFNHSDAADESMKNVTRKYPSPTTYHKDIDYLPDSPQYSIPKLDRPEPASKTIKINNPGPGKYDPEIETVSHLKKVPSWTISKSNRDEDAKVPGSKKVHIINPGPGFYNDKSGKLPQGPSYSFKHVVFKEKIEQKPGPGTYDIKLINKSNEPHYSIGKEKRGEDLKQIEKNNFPGPGAYKIRYLKPKEISFPITKRVEPKIIDFPGPGHYKIPTAFDYVNGLARLNGAFDPTFKYV